MFVKWTRHVMAEVLQYALMSMVQTDYFMCLVNMVRQKREIYILTWAVFPQVFSFGRYRLNYQVPTGIQFNEAHMYVCSCRKQGHISDM